MRIVLSGGGTGGHFYPLIAVAEAVKDLAKTEKILPPEFFFLSPTPYDERTLFEEDVAYRRIPAGKMRRYFSLRNFTDSFATASGILSALSALYRIYPDVVFAKGGYASFPVLMAAKLLSIPVVIHESDIKPGRVNSWAGAFARRVAVSYPECVVHFPKEKVFVSGQPIRKRLMLPITEGAREFLKLEEGVPVILAIGGSQGAEAINNVILDLLPQLVEHYQIVHQVGDEHVATVEGTARVILKGNKFAERYRPFGFLNELALRMSAGVASIAVTRAGSGLFEFGAWGMPTIIIPIPEEVSHDQTGNAFAYARTGAGVVIAEKNLTPAVLKFEVDRLMQDQSAQEAMRTAARSFVTKDAAEKIAYELLAIAVAHERG